MGILYQKLNTAVYSLALPYDLGLCWLPPVKDAKITLVGRNLGIANHMDEERVKFAWFVLNWI